MTHATVHGEARAATTDARLCAAALAEHANACAVADAFLADGTTPDPENIPPNLVLAVKDAVRGATLDAETPDERTFTSNEALQVYVRHCLVKNMTVRRMSWTLASPADGRIEPDTARLLLRGSRPTIDIVASIGMDGVLDTPILRHEDEEDGMLMFNHADHGLNKQGVAYVARLFRART